MDYQQARTPIQLVDLPRVGSHLIEKVHDNEVVPIIATTTSKSMAITNRVNIRQLTPYH